MVHRLLYLHLHQVDQLHHHTVVDLLLVLVLLFHQNTKVSHIVSIRFIFFSMTIVTMISICFLYSNISSIIVIPQSETLIVLNALNSKTTRNGARWSHYAEFMLQTAMRTGEVRALKWEDIKENKVLVHGNYTLTHGYKNSTKTNRKRWVPLNIKTQEILDKTKKVDEYIFPWNRYAFQSYFYDRMSELHKEGIIENRYRPYDLRHTAISRWIEAQIPVAQVANWAGNNSEVIWQHYVNVTKDYEMPVL